MANFDSGIKKYIQAEAVVTVRFPVDWNGKEHIACRHCQYLSSNEKMCQLNKQPVAFPDRYIGDDCPLTEIK